MDSEKNRVKAIKRTAIKIYRRLKVYVKMELLYHCKTNETFVFLLSPKAGTTKKAIFRYAEDVQIAMNVRQFKPFTMENRLLLAVSSSNESPKIGFDQILNSPVFRHNPDKLLVCLGYDILGTLFVIDLADMPHAMYVGATNSGKSMGLICLVLSLISHQHINKVNLVLCDMGGKSLDVFEGVPHLSHPIVTDEMTGAHVIDAIHQEMDRRLNADMEEIVSLPAIVCVIDEFVSFMDRTKKLPGGADVAGQITDILRRGRKAKIHMVIATQDPKADSMRVDIGNITSRMVFKCATYQASANVINCSGAEKLSGKGEMLFVSADHPHPTFIQGAYVSPQETKELVSAISSQSTDSIPKFVIPEVFEDSKVPGDTVPVFHTPKPLVTEEVRKKANVVMWALGNDTISTERIKKEFHIGNQAKGLMNFLSEQNIVSEPHGNLPRSVLVKHRDQLSEPVLELLHSCGYSDEDIAAAIGGQNTDSSMNSETTETIPQERV